MERCVAAARARRLVCTNKADRMSLPFRGTHAPAVQGAGAACVGGARGGRVSVAHEQPPTVDAPTYIHACRLQPSRPMCDFAKTIMPPVEHHFHRRCIPPCIARRVFDLRPCSSVTPASRATATALRERLLPAA